MICILIRIPLKTNLFRSEREVCRDRAVRRLLSNPAGQSKGENLQVLSKVPLKQEKFEQTPQVCGLSLIVFLFNFHFFTGCVQRNVRREEVALKERL